MVLSCAERAVNSAFFSEEKIESSYIQMDGQEVYKFATKQVPACIQQALEKVEMTVDDVDWFLLHQANVRIIESVAKHLKADYVHFHKDSAHL